MSATDARWYVGKTGNHQGLVIDERDGRNVAVAYDKADAPLLAAAPALLAALATLVGIAEADCMDDKSNVWRSAMLDAGAALALAEGTHNA